MPLGKSCRCVQILTPKRYLLNGLWFGAARPATALIFVHGLGSHAFAHHNYLVSLASGGSAVLFFSNRGHDGVAAIKKLKPSAKKGYVYEPAGVAHETFTECVDDIQGAVNLLARRGARRIYLVGHSTGCQKIAFYLGRPTKLKRIAGAVLLCPISDYAGAHHEDERKRMKAEVAAKKLVRRNRPHELLPAHLWRGPIDAQRFLSLYTPDSKEEIFTYAQPRKIPRTLHGVKAPLLVVFAGEDEYRDRDTQQIANWFRENLRSKQSAILIIPGASHSFNGKEATVARAIRRWIAQQN
ncbi:MAG: alpha/beta fold hydrolase [Candidatus Acidiferrales bacterium]